jgi:putative oxidoreductase
MSIPRRFARPLLAAMFIEGGLDAIRNPEMKVEKAKAVIDPLKERLPALPDDTVMLVKLNGMVQIGAGGLLAIGKFRRLAAIALIGSVIPTTYAEHRFWEEGDDEARAQQRVHFLKNAGLLGGLILAAVDTEGAPSIGWKTRRKAQSVSHVVSLGHTSTAETGHRVGAKAAETGRKAKRQANKAAIRANKAAVKGGRRANKAVSKAATSGLALAAPFIRQANEAAHHAAQAAREGAEGGAHRASSKAVETRRVAGRKAKKTARWANKSAQTQGRRANQAIVNTAATGGDLAAPYVHHANESAHHAVHHAKESAHHAVKAARESAEPVIAAGVERAEELLAKVTEHLSS